MVLWFIGMSGAGKSLISQTIYHNLKPHIPNLILLDGDALREMYAADIDHSLEGRRKSHERFSRLSKFLSDQNIHVIAAALSIFPDLRQWNKDNIKDYCQVYMKVSMDQLKERDTKNLYANAAAGTIKNVVGVDIKFPEPINNDLVINNSYKDEDLHGYIQQVMNLPSVAKLTKKLN